MQLFYTEPVNWDQCCKPCHQLRKGNPNPNESRKETSRKMRGLWPLQSFTQTAQQGSYGAIHLFIIDTGGWEKGKRKRLLTKIRETISGSWLPVGTSIIFSALWLSLCPTAQPWALPCWPRKLWCCTWVIQTPLLPCSQHRQLLTNNDSADKLESELCL